MMGGHDLINSLMAEIKNGGELPTNIPIDEVNVSIDENTNVGSNTNIDSNTNVDSNTDIVTDEEMDIIFNTPIDSAINSSAITANENVLSDNIASEKSLDDLSVSGGANENNPTETNEKKDFDLSNFII